MFDLCQLQPIFSSNCTFFFKICRIPPSGSGSRCVPLSGGRNNYISEFFILYFVCFYLHVVCECVNPPSPFLPHFRFAWVSSEETAEISSFSVSVGFYFFLVYFSSNCFDFDISCHLFNWLLHWSTLCDREWSVFAVKGHVFQELSGFSVVFIVEKVIFIV